MSASKSKRQRQAMYQSGQLDKHAEEKQRRQRRRRHLIITAVVLAVVIAAGTAAALISTGFLASHTTAAVTGSHALTGSMFSYFYYDTYQAFAQQNPTMASQILNPDISFAQQTYSQENHTTWADYFLSEAAVLAAETYRMYDAAVAAGYTLSEEDEQTLESNRASLESIPSLLPTFRSADDYIRATYGRGCTAEGYLEYARLRMTASSFAEQYREDLHYSDEDIQAAYTANPLDYDTVSYKIFYSSVVIGQNEDGTVYSDMELSEANARDMAEQCRGDLDRFNEMTVELAAESKKDTYRDPDFSLRENLTVSSANDKLVDWLTDPDREYGDTTYVQADERGYYVAFFIDYSDNDYRLANFRQISIPATADADNAADPDGMDQARQDAKAILDKFEDGARTGDAFSALAQEQSGASGADSAPCFPGQADDAVEQWCYDEAREPGDYAMLRGDSGYFIVWFDGYGGNYRDYLVEEALRQEDYDAWYEQITAGEPAALRSLGVFFMSK